MNLLKLNFQQHQGPVCKTSNFPDLGCNVKKNAQSVANRVTWVQHFTM